MENVLFKISFPAEFHAQTAVECAIQLHDQVKDRLEPIDKVVITTQESAIRIIDKSGPLHNPADRDHCIQYMTAVGLIFGELTADHYEDKVAQDPRIDALRDKMTCVEDPRYTQRVSGRRQALHRQRRAGLLQRRLEQRKSRGRISHRPSPPPRRRHAAAGEKVRDEFGIALRAGAMQSDFGFVQRFEVTRRNAGR